jgi:simple sugar transport system substrate-binding protein
MYLAGEEMGTHIASLVPSGDVAMFIATPGSANIQPRINGALATLKSHPSITTHVVATGAAIPAELTVISSYAQGHPNTKGMFAVDAGSTQGVAQTIQKQGLKGKVMGGGFDLLTPTIDLLQAGYIQFTIDQQPYLQGFLPTLQLYMYLASQKLTGVADVDTGLKFLDQTSVAPYVSSKSRYEGSSTSPGVTKS